MTELVGIHYQLCAYVCGRACIKPGPFEGWATFTQIVQSRPDNCRYAVARMAPVVKAGDTYTVADPTGPFIVWDLHDEELVRGHRTDGAGLIAPPPALWMGDTEDGMVMKAMARYDHDT